MNHPDNTQWDSITKCLVNPKTREGIHINEAITEGPHMITIPGPMGQNVPMIVNAALCADCVPGSRKDNGLIKPTSNGLIKP